MTSVATSNFVFRFGVFEADLRSGELRKNGVKVKIQELPFRALKLLLSRPNEILTREQFRQALWPDGVFVDFDHGISSAINRLRDALGDSADNPVFVETVERRGYRWIAPTHNPAPAPQPVQAVATAQPIPAAQAVVEPKIEPVVVHPTAPPTRWQWILALPAIALVFVAWSFRPAYHAAKAGTSAPAASSLPNANLPRRATNPEAEDLYLKGRFYWNKRSPDSLNKAVDFFTQAIVHDPSYAPAYVGLADCYNLLREYTVMPSTEAYPRALAAAKKAVELDDHSSEAHASVAFASFYGMWDAATAEREFRRAIELDPNNAVAHHWYATYLMTVRRFPEALAEIERARALDPSSPSIVADKGDILLSAGRREEATSLLKQMEIQEPDFVSPHRYLKFLYLDTRDYRNYLVEDRKEALLLHDPAETALAIAAEKGFARGGPQGMWQNMQTLQKKFYDQGTGSPFRLAETYSMLGKRPEALQYLKVAYERRDERLLAIQSDSAFRNLHDEPAYRDLIAHMGLPLQN